MPYVSLLRLSTSLSRAYICSSLLSALCLSGCITYNLNPGEESPSPYEEGEQAGAQAGAQAWAQAGAQAGTQAWAQAGTQAGAQAGAQLTAGVEARAGTTAGSASPLCPLDTPCDDDDPCTYDDRCDESGVCVGEELSCFSDGCVERWCDGSATCASRVKTGDACDDGVACTHSDRCDAAGACVGTPLSCSSDGCVERWCDGSATCVSRVKEGDACDDGVACTHSDRCDAAGACVGTPLSCSSDACVERWCDGLSTCASRVKEGDACDDGAACTHSDRCDAAGACVGTPLSCSSDACVERWCDGSATCASRVKTGDACDDGAACTHSDRCNAAGVCVGTSISCSSSECVQRSCNGTASCTQVYTTQSCNDGQACTYNDRCQGGSCRGDAISCASDDCVTRSCNGTSQCSATIHAGRACGTAPACKSQSCNASGACVQSSLANGTSCGSSAQRCCGGSCVDTGSNVSNCGGCGIACEAGYACYPFNGTGQCGCGGTNSYCVEGARTSANCYNPGSGWRCQCLSDSGCAPGQRCNLVTGLNYCTY